MDRRLLMLALGMFAMGTDNFVVAGILPSIAEALNTSVSLAGQMVTVYALSYPRGVSLRSTPRDGNTNEDQRRS